jgi:anti-sigma factor RsiW
VESKPEAGAPRMAVMIRAEIRLPWPVRDEWHVLTGSYALDALGPQERGRFERHLHRCASCDAEVRGLRETAARLAMARSLRPPPGLQDRVIAATHRTRQLPPPSGRPLPLGPARLLAARLATVLRGQARLSWAA